MNYSPQGNWACYQKFVISKDPICEPQVGGLFFSTMNIHSSILASTVAALLLVSVTGCQSSGSASTAAAGPATGAVLLSQKKTFDIIGRSGKEITYSKPEGPEADVTSQTIRTKLESLGYQYQPGSPDFVVSVAWDKTQKLEPATPTAIQLETPVSSSAMVVDKATLSVAVRDVATGSILWQSPVSEAWDPNTVTEDAARSVATVALKDFPPSQAVTSQASSK